MVFTATVHSTSFRPRGEYELQLVDTFYDSINKGGFRPRRGYELQLLDVLRSNCKRVSVPVGDMSCNGLQILPTNGRLCFRPRGGYELQQAYQ